MTPAQAAAKNKGWVDKNNPNYGTSGFIGPEDEEGYQAPAAPVPPPPGGVPAAQPPLPAPPPGVGGIARPVASGPLMAPPMPGAEPRVAAPNLGPLVDVGGIATHQPPPPAAPVAGPQSIDPAAGTGAAPVAAAPAAPAAAPANPLNTALKDALLKLLGQGDPSLSDPALAAQSGAFGVQQQRAKERARSAMAERAAAEGGPGVDSGAFEGGLRQLEEQQGEALASSVERTVFASGGARGESTQRRGTAPVSKGTRRDECGAISAEFRAGRQTVGPAIRVGRPTARRNRPPIRHDDASGS